MQNDPLDDRSKLVIIYGLERFQLPARFSGHTVSDETLIMYINADHILVCCYKLLPTEMTENRSQNRRAEFESITLIIAQTWEAN